MTDPTLEESLQSIEKECDREQCRDTAVTVEDGEFLCGEHLLPEFEPEDAQGKRPGGSGGAPI